MHSNNVNANLPSNPISGAFWGAVSGALGAAVVTLITPTAPVSVPAAAVVFAIAGAIEALARPCFGGTLSYVGGLFAGHALVPFLGYSLAGRAVVHVALANISINLVVTATALCCYGGVLAVANLRSALA